MRGFIHLPIRAMALLMLAFALLMPAAAKKSSRKPAAQKTTTKATTELEKLRDEYIKATKDYKASLEKLVPLYEKNLQAAETRLANSKELFAQGLISKNELEKAEQKVVSARADIQDARKQMDGADTQIAQVLVEIETEKQMGKLKRVPKGGMIMTTAFIRFNGAGPWSIAQANTIDAFFRQRFGRPLPIAVLGQGAIHNRWRLDHRNAMDLSLNPDGVEGKAVTDFLRSQGIPFSAFRQAIPGTATGPHIHVGLPSHRY